MKKFFITSLIAAGALAGAIEFRIEGEHVPNKDAWTFGSDGSAVGGYVATSEKYKKDGGAANNATGSYGVPAAGKYYVWVRTLDFGEGYRKTQIKINGQSIGKFGDAKIPVKGKPIFQWKRAMLPVELKDKIELELIPLSSLGRIDSLLFTQDEQYKPSDNGNEVTEAVEELESF